MRRLNLVLAFVFCAVVAEAVPLSGSETPDQFFNKVAGALLKEQAAVDLHHISIFPTNKYSPEVHRLLQVTANLYDSTTNRGDAYPWLPTCFRPQFGSDGEEIFISGYVQQTGADFTDRPWHEVDDVNDQPIAPDDNVYGIPIIIGARKGFPNFNEFVLQTAAQFTRRLEVRRERPEGPPTETNQMFIVGVSNALAMELWNPWSNDYPRSLSVKAVTETTSILSNRFSFIQQVCTRTPF